MGVQVALSVIMLFCGGLFLRSLHNIRSVEKGFDSSGVLIANTDASRARLDADRLRALYRDIVDRLAALPGVKAASVSTLTPIWGGGNEGTIVVVGGNPLQQKGEVIGQSRQSRLFRDDRHAIHTGRDFSWQDTADGPKVAIVNQKLSRQYSERTVRSGSALLFAETRWRSWASWVTPGITDCAVRFRQRCTCIGCSSAMTCSKRTCD